MFYTARVSTTYLRDISSIIILNSIKPTEHLFRNIGIF